MKARAVSLVLFHFHPGHHREVNAWHDADHRPEVLGTIPHIFHSQRWVAPADYVAARPPTDLPRGGGEYAVVYWSDGEPEQIQANFEALGIRLALQDRMQPMRYIEGVWRGRLRPLLARVAHHVRISPEAVPFAPSTGLVVSIVELADPGQGQAYGRWLDAVHVPAVLRDDLFTALFVLVPAVPSAPNVLVHLYYTEASDPLRPFAELLRREEQRSSEEAGLATTRRLFAGVYRPIAPGEYDFYD